MATGGNTIDIRININTQQVAGAMNGMQGVINGSLRGMMGSFARFGLGVGVVIGSIKALEAAGKAMYSVFEKGIEVTVNTERATAGVAGLLATLYEIKDASGKIVEGPDKFNEALKISKERMRELRIEAIKSALSFEELSASYLQALGPGNSAGLDDKQVQALTVRLGSIGKTVLPRAGMLPQEVRALLSGKIDKNATIGSMLQFGPKGANQKAYQEALKTGKIYEYLMEKTKEFDKAAKLQSQGVGGTIDQVKDLYGLFSMDVSSGLVTELVKIQKITDSLFDKDTKEWDKSLQPLMVTFDTIGTMLGKEILGAIETIVGWAKKFGEYISEDQSIINMFAEGWELTKGIVLTVIETIGSIASVVIDLISLIFGGLNESFDQTNEKLTTSQLLSKVFVGFVSAIAIGFAFVKDIVTGIGGALKIVIGNAITLIEKIDQAKNNAKASIYAAMGDKEKEKEFTDAAAKNQRKADLGQDFAYKDNKLLENVNNYGLFAGVLKSVTKEADKAANAINNVGKKTNTTWQETFKRLADGLKKKPAGSTTPGEHNEDANKKIRAMANAQYALEKAKIEGEIAITREKNSELLALNQDLFDRNIITVKEYYDKKRELSKKSFDDEMKLLEMEQKEASTRAIDPEKDKDLQLMQNKIEVKKIEEKILLLKEKQANATASIGREEINVLNAKKKQSSLNDIENAKLDAEASLQIAKINQDEQLALKGIGITRSLEMDRSRLKEEYDLEVQAIEKKKELSQLSLQEKEQLNEDLKALDRKYRVDKAKIDSEIVLDSKKDSIEIQKSFEDNFASLIEQIASGQKSFLDGVKGFAKAIEAEFLRLAAKNLAASIFGGGGSSGGANIWSTIGGAILGAFTGSGVGGTSSAPIDWSNIGANAGSSPEWANIGSSLQSFDVGTNYVPNDMIAQIHKGEAIVPAKFNNKASMGGVNVSNNFHFSQPPDQRTQLQMATMAGAELQRALRRNG